MYHIIDGQYISHAIYAVSNVLYLWYTIQYDSYISYNMRDVSCIAKLSQVHTYAHMGL